MAFVSCFSLIPRALFAELISVAMADSQDSGLFQRKIILGVDASEHSEQAFDCKYEMR